MVYNNKRVYKMAKNYINVNIVNIDKDGRPLPVRSKLIKLSVPYKQFVDSISKYYPFITKNEIDMNSLTGLISVTKILPCNETFYRIADDTIEAIEYFAKHKTTSRFPAIFNRG